MKMLGVVGARSATHSEMVLEDQFFVLCFRLCLSLWLFQGLKR